METINGLELIHEPLEQCILTVGNFDGVHRAHREILLRAREFAGRSSGPVVVLTFEPHPLTIVAPKRAPSRLLLVEDKLRYLQEAGADIVVVARSSPELLSMEAERFVEDVLIARFHPTHIVEGPSFGFGRGRKGDPSLLREVASRFHCDVQIVDPVRIELGSDERVLVSSSLIRRLLEEARVEDAAVCLGRPYALLGKVVRGEGRGRAMGFPTANLRVPDVLVPGEGVFAGEACWEDVRVPSAISIGHTPTFGGHATQVEAHLLDFDGDLYGRTLRLEFIRKLRCQHRFSSAAQLAEQLDRDVEAVRNGAFGSEPDVRCLSGKPK